MDLALVGAGRLLGAYTTFSTWTYELAALLSECATLAALFNLFGSLFRGRGRDRA